MISANARKAHLFLLGSAAGVLLSASAALAADDKLVIVTSYAAELTDVIKAAFTKANPSINVEIVNKNTSAGVKYLQETAANNQSDLFWASAPDAFEVLKANDLLQKYTSDIEGVASEIGNFPIDDPDGFYRGFALSGYGFMWNTRYMESFDLPEPKEWEDLTKPVYFGHIGISSPSRSGTTHLTVETILQGEGWEKGWETIKQIGGNSQTIPERSFGVPDGVNSGTFGIGIVIDFFGLSSQASGFPVEFEYPSVTALVPANIGIVANAPDVKPAQIFIDYLLSPEGQTLLFDPKIMRLPVNQKAYEKAPEGLPNPFKGDIKASVDFDTGVSEERYNVVNSLFDVMVTYRLGNLQAATKAIHSAEKALAETPNPEAQKLLDEAKALVAKVPVTAEQATDPDFNAIFKVKRKKSDDKVEGRQAEVEQEWDAQIVDNYAKAAKLAQQAEGML